MTHGELGLQQVDGLPRLLHGVGPQLRHSEGVDTRRLVGGAGLEHRERLGRNRCRDVERVARVGQSNQNENLSRT